MISRYILFSAAVLLLTGCPSYATFHSTRTAPKGSLEATAGISKSLVGESAAARAKTDVVVIGRFGILDNLDLGLRLRTDFTAGAELKLRFLDGEKLQMAIAPGFYMSLLAPMLNGVAWLAERTLDSDDSHVKAFAYEAHLPLIFGIPFQDNVFLFGPKLVITNWSASISDPTETLPQGVQFGTMLWHPGVMVGLDWVPGRNIRVLPEINVHFDFYGSVFVHAGIAVLR